LVKRESYESLDRRTDGSRSDDGRVEAAAVYDEGGWRALHSYLRKRRMEVFDPELWAYGKPLKRLQREQKGCMLEGCRKR